MKVLLIFTYGVSLRDWHNFGILEREISLYKQLSKKKVKVIFLTYGSNEDYEFSYLIKDIDIIPISKFVKSRLSKIYFIKSLLIPLKLKDIFKNVDIIKTNQIRGSWIACIAKLFYKKKIIIRGGFEWLNQYKISTIKRGLKNYIYYILNYIWIFLNELICYKIADGIILSNEEDISFIIRTFHLNRKSKKKKIQLIPNFIDIDLFKPLSLTKKDKNILFIGSLKRIKNLSSVFEALKDLKDFSLDIIGDGPEEKSLKKKAKELEINVNFLGTISNNKLPEIINKYFIFILPSLYEGNPKALLEAMSCGIACIGTNVHGINSIIIHKQNGYLCGTSPSAIRNAILTIYENINLRQKIGKNARNYIVNNCALGSITKKEYIFYKELIRN